MKQKQPKDLIEGDKIILVSFNPNKTGKAKILTVEVGCHNKQAGAYNYRLLKKYGWFLFENIKWEEVLDVRYKINRFKIFPIEDMDRAKLFAEVEVPKLQFVNLGHDLDRITSEFHSKTSDFQRLEKIVENNIKQGKIWESN